MSLDDTDVTQALYQNEGIVETKLYKNETKCFKNQRFRTAEYGEIRQSYNRPLKCSQEAALPLMKR
jgi:hypothetical protein